jgi:hypothetical protein
LLAGEFGADDGSADPALRAALVAVDQGRGAAADVVDALLEARVIVAVVAVLGEDDQPAAADQQETGDRQVEGDRATGGVEGDKRVEGDTRVEGDKRADMALVTLTGPDGRRALPVFSSADALLAWDPAARPVPVTSRRAAHAALAEECERLVLDAAGPVTFLASRSVVVALAQGRRWRPPHEDAAVTERVDAMVAGEPDVVRVSRRPGSGAELRVELVVRPGLTREELNRLATRISERVSVDEVLRERADGLELAVVSV